MKKQGNIGRCGLVLCGLWLLLLGTMAGCGESKGTAAEEAGGTAQAAAAEGTADAAQAADSEAAADAAAGTDADSSVTEAEEGAVGDFTYAELDGYEFYLSDDIDNWATWLSIDADGNFAGVYHNSYMEEIDEEEYPYGSITWCEFQGKLSAPVKLHAFAYMLQIEELTYADEVGTEEVEGGIVYRYAEACGLDGASQLCLYLPGMPVSEISDTALSWLQGTSSPGTGRLSSYALVSLPGEWAFSGTYYGAEGEYGDDSLTGTVLLENPSWGYYLSDLAETKALVGYTLDQVSQEPNEIIDEDRWFSENGLTKPGTEYTKGDYAYAISGWNETPYVTVTSVLTGDTVTYDLSAYAMAPEYAAADASYVDQHVFYAEAVDGILYFATGHSTYASSCAQTAYLTAVDLSSGRLLWKSAPLTCNSATFAVVDDYIVCGYGFTAEDDYLKVLRRDNGVIEEEVLLKSAPEYILLKDGILYVRCYNTNYMFQMAMG